MDGARIFNAAVHLNVPLRAIAGDVGIDALSFGGTKNGLIAGEAVVFFKRFLADDFEFRRMQGMQLSSKMRFIAAQFSALLNDGLWSRSAAHSNGMARLLAGELAGIPGVALTHVVEANEVFVTLPPAIVPKLQEQWPFHIWNEAKSEARLIASFDTEESDVRDFVALVRETIGSRAKTAT
jgi:threonine aldolase